MDGARRALIVANDEYEHEGLRRLRAPAADADALAGVLGDAGIGAFDVRVVRNEPAHVIEGQIEDMFTDGRPGDVLLLHFSCHGLKNESGELFFAARNTRPNRLASTAISADFVQHCMRASRSRTIVLLLDCCYGGAFSQGVSVRASGDVNVLDSFPGGRLGGGRGRAVITASSAMEYAFEGDQLADEQGARPSVFTSALVEGLATGDADRDQDGWISLNELYDYIFDRVREQNPHQTPSRDVEMQGELYLARRSRPVTTPAPLPPELQEVLDNPLARVRAGAVEELERLLHGRHAGLSLAARVALAGLANDDSRTVAAAASAVLAGDPGHRPDPAVRMTPHDAGPPSHADDVAPAAPLKLSASELDFGWVPQHGEPVWRSVRLGTAGDATIAARATTSASWLDLRLIGDRLAVGLDTTAAVGDHEDVITVQSEGGGSAEIRVRATLVAAAGDDAAATIQTEDAPLVAEPGRGAGEPLGTAIRHGRGGSAQPLDAGSAGTAPPDQAPRPQDEGRPPDRRHLLGSPRARFTAAAGVLLAAGGVSAAVALLPSDGSGSTEKTVDVSATTPWTGTGVACSTGRKLDITASGTVLHNKASSGSAVGPNGNPDPSLRQFNVAGLSDVNHAALIGSIDRAEPFFLVGAKATLACTGAGELFLGVNDAGLTNNSGQFVAKITQRG